MSEVSDQAPSSSGSFSMATFNLAELFDTLDDPSREDQVLSSSEYERRLQKRALVISQELQHPAVLALQEVENEIVLRDLLDRPEIQVGYDFVIEPGPDVRGLNVALLYRPDLATLLSAASRQGCTGLQDGMEPDGNGDPQEPQNELTCDRDGDGVLDGNRLFSRPPLVAHLLGRIDGGQVGSVSLASYDFWLVVVHLKSKVGDSSFTAFTLQRRLEQVDFVADLVQEIREGDPPGQIIVLGDFNDHPDSQPLAILAQRGLQSTSGMVARQERYTYIYRGISQTLDDILFFPNQLLAPAAVRSVHVNADYPYAFASLNGSVHRSSDHDPLLVDWVVVSPAAYFPLVRR
jgi:predicted extracellular nuclease